MKKAHPTLAFIMAAILILGLIVFLIAPLVGAAEMTLAQSNQMVNSASTVNTNPGVSSYSNVNGSYNGYGYSSTDPYYAGYNVVPVQNGYVNTYYGNIGIVGNGNSYCGVFNRILSYGISGSDVSALQAFLNGRGLLNVAPTGYFGALTRTALATFQASSGLQQTGVLDASTQNRIVASCSGSNGGGSSNGNGGSSSSNRVPTATSLSPKTGKIGTSVTIKGKYFDRENNYILFDGKTAAVIPSSDGKTLRFTVPEYMSKYCPAYTPCIQLAYAVQAQTYDVTVRNSAGESTGLLTFKVTDTSGGSQSNKTPHIDSYRANTIYYANGGGAQTQSTYFAPSAPAKQVTLYGTGFTSSNQIYSNGSRLYADIPASQGGTELSFTVVGNNSSCGSYYCTDVYRKPFDDMQIYVKNTNGSSNTIDLNLNDDSI